MKRKANNITQLEDLTRRLIDGFFISLIAIVIFAGAIFFYANFTLPDQTTQLSGQDRYMQGMIEGYNRALGAAAAEASAHSKKAED